MPIGAGSKCDSQTYGRTAPTAGWELRHAVSGPGRTDSPPPPSPNRGKLSALSSAQGFKLPIQALGRPAIIDSIGKVIRCSVSSGERARAAHEKWQCRPQAVLVPSMTTPSDAHGGTDAGDQAGRG